MSDWDDLEGVTPRISNDDAERLLSGTSRIDEPHDLADLSAILASLRGPAENAELTGLQSALVAFRAAVVATQFDPSIARTRLMFKKRLTRKTLTAIGVVTLVSAGAAAAGGLVPTPFSAPRPSITKTTDADADDQGDEIVANDVLDSTTTTTEADEPDATEADAAKAADDVTESTGQGPDVNGPAKFGLCTAFAARTKHDEATTTTGAATPPAEPVTTDSLPLPFQKLSDAAATATQSVAEFCADAVPGGAEHAADKAGDNPSATAPGQSDDNPSATAPGKSGDNPSVTAPGKSGEHGGSHGKP
jgi:hypothetical protein